MAVLLHERSGLTAILHANHLVGRSERCDLRIDENYVSTEHASIRWNGQAWFLKDLGSRNQTYVDGASVSAAQPVLLNPGSTLAFGRKDDTWRLQDLSAPEAVAIPLDGGEPLVGVNALLPVPSSIRPAATVYRGSDGGWKLDEEGETRNVEDGGVFEVDGRSFRLSLPSAVLPTVPVGSLEALRITDLELHFSVSSDEEHVEIVAASPGKLQHLGSRSHNYLILELARRRAADADSKLPETSCGWIYQDELCERLRVDVARLNVDVYRIRKQFAHLELLDPATIIERRARTKQLRLGVKRFSIRQV
jgi:hypothetical protein